MKQDVVGLSTSESKIYRAILNLKTATVRDISKRIGVHRTNIYDVLEKLKEKGLVSYYKEGKVMHYKCSDPNNLSNYWESQKEELNEIIPELKKIYNQSISPIEIEIFKGKKGLISCYKDVLRDNNPVKGFLISRRMKEHLPKFRERFITQVKKQNLKFELIYTQKLPRLPPPFVSRYLEQQFDNPIVVFLYGNKTLQIIWEPRMRAILIRSKGFTDSYRKHFEIFWNISKPM